MKTIFRTIAIVFVAGTLLGGCYRGVGESPLDAESLYSNSQKERLGRHANESILVQVSLKEWMSISELEALLGDIDGELISLQTLITEEDISSTNHGLQAGIDAEGHMSASDAVRVSLLEHAQRLEDRVPMDAQKMREKAESSELTSVYTYTFRMQANSSDALRWWEEHSEKVRFVQSIIHPADNTQHAFLPEEQLP